MEITSTIRTLPLQIGFNRYSKISSKKTNVQGELVSIILNSVIRLVSLEKKKDITFSNHSVYIARTVSHCLLAIDYSLFMDVYNASGTILGLITQW